MTDIITEQGFCWGCGKPFHPRETRLVRSRSYDTRSGTITRLFCCEACAVAHDEERAASGFPAIEPDGGEWASMNVVEG